MTMIVAYATALVTVGVLLALLTAGLWGQVPWDVKLAWTAAGFIGSGLGLGFLWAVLAAVVELKFGSSEEEAEDR